MSALRILVLCSANAPEFDVRLHQAFVYEQVEALKRTDPNLTFDYFFVRGKGLRGYLSCRRALLAQIRTRTYDCIHAHVAFSGLLANLQRRVPVVTTFHGSDINVPQLRAVSLLVELLSRRTIYVSQSLLTKALWAGKRKRAVIPCGVDLDRFVPRPKADSRRLLGLNPGKKYVLFSSGFNNPVKNYPLARRAVALLPDPRPELLELKDYSREEVALLLTAVDVALLTSWSEGSPQFVKEALACNCPVVATPVGDVATVLAGVPGCYLTSFQPEGVAEALRAALSVSPSGGLRERAQLYDNRLVAGQIRTLYHQL